MISDNDEGIENNGEGKDEKKTDKKGPTMCLYKAMVLNLSWGLLSLTRGKHHTHRDTHTKRLIHFGQWRCHGLARNHIKSSR